MVIVATQLIDEDLLMSNALKAIIFKVGIAGVTAADVALNVSYAHAFQVFFDKSPDEDLIVAIMAKAFTLPSTQVSTTVLTKAEYVSSSSASGRRRSLLLTNDEKEKVKDAPAAQGEEDKKQMSREEAFARMNYVVNIYIFAPDFASANSIISTTAKDTAYAASSDVASAPGVLFVLGRAVVLIMR